jgi:transposase InsO family protein
VSRFTFILAEKAYFPVAVMCRVLAVSRSGLHAWCSRPVSAHARVDAELAIAIRAAHEAGRGTYGTRRVRRHLRKLGLRVGHKRVSRLRAQAGLTAKRQRCFKVTTNSRHTNPVAPNVLARSFDVPNRNTAWVTDVTYVWTIEGWLYLAAILDLSSRRVVGWAASSKNDCKLATDALIGATSARRPAAGWIHHSDRGTVYASAEYRAELARLGGTASMSRKGNCWDNAVAESFFASLKGECLDHEQLHTRVQAKGIIADYIEFYNLRRMHSTIDYESPIEYELKRLSQRKVA